MPPFHPHAHLVPSLIAAARADCGMLAQVLRNRWRRARRRSLRWGGWRRSRGSGAPAGPRGAGGLLHRLHHPSVLLELLLARPEPGLVVVCLRRQAGSPSLVLLKTTQPLPYLASCRASSPTRRTRSL